MTETGATTLSKLTPAEKYVLVGICEGQTNAELAAVLGSSVQTIKNRVRAILAKTRRSNRLELAIFAFHHGIVECPCGRKEKP